MKNIIIATGIGTSLLFGSFGVGDIQENPEKNVSINAEVKIKTPGFDSGKRQNSDELPESN